MEVGKEVLSGLQLCGEDSVINGESYAKLLCHATSILQSGSCIETETTLPVAEKKAIFGLTSFITECSRYDASVDEIRAILEESRLSTQRINQFIETYRQHKDSVRSNLSRISTLSRAKIVDINWRLDYNIKTSQSEKVNQLSYLVNLHTQEPDEREIKIVNFTCSLEQLQDLVGKLKDAVRCVEKQVVT